MSEKITPPADLVKEKLDAFRAAFDLYFADQYQASTILMVGQGTISRYLSGVTLVSADTAKRFEDYTGGLIRAEDIYFDAKAYRFSQRQQKKQSEKSSQKQVA